MFVSKKRFEELERRVKWLESQLDEKHLASDKNFPYLAYPVVARFKDLLDHLGIEWKESTTSGYVKRGKK